MPVSQGTDASIKFEIRGYNRVRNSMRKLIASAKFEDDVNDVMRQWAEETRMFLKRRRYAPKPANSRYVRTGRLASSWRKEQVKPGVWIFLNNAASPKTGKFYARYVVGTRPDKSGPANQRQTKTHFDNKWWNADDEIEKERIPELTVILSELYVDLWNAE